MVVRYKQKCQRCKKNYVVVMYRLNYTICYDCQKNELKGEVKDPKMKRLFNIPEEFYIENTFLRNIKITYLRYKKLTEKQLELFKKVSKELKEEKGMK